MPGDGLAVLDLQGVQPGSFRPAHAAPDGDGRPGQPPRSRTAPGTVPVPAPPGCANTSSMAFTDRSRSVALSFQRTSRSAKRSPCFLLGPLNAQYLHQLSVGHQLGAPFLTCPEVVVPDDHETVARAHLLLQTQDAGTHLPGIFIGALVAPGRAHRPPPPVSSERRGQLVLQVRTFDPDHIDPFVLKRMSGGSTASWERSSVAGSRESACCRTTSVSSTAPANRS